jgi:hypothetical protein
MHVLWIQYWGAGSEGGKLIGGGVFPAKEACNKYDLTAALLSAFLVMKPLYIQMHLNE